MHQSRLVEVFRILDKKDLRNLEKYVKSPFFNTRKDVIDLFSYLRKLHPFKKNKGLHREEIYQALFPGTTYDEKLLGYAFSFLFKNIKGYFAYQEMNGNPVNEQIQLSIALRKRGVKRIFESELNIAEKLLEQRQLRNPEFYYYQYLIAQERYNIHMGNTRDIEGSLQQISEGFAHFFISNHLRISSAVLTYKDIQMSGTQTLLLEDIVKHVEENDYSHVPAISIYYYTFKTIKEKDSAPYFYKLRELIKIHFDCFSNQEIRDIYVFTINYCIKQTNNGQNEFLEILFDIYKDGLRNDVFLIYGEMSRFTYKNIVTTGLRVKEFNWVENFLFEYKDTIEAKYRENTFNYNLAILYYRKPDFEKAMQLLQQAEFHDPLLNLNARRMLLTIYYSEKEFDALQSHLDSFKNYIYRHKELGYHRNHNLNLIRFTRKLLQLKSERAAINKLREDINNTKEVSEKSWLLEQVDNFR